MQIDNLSHGRYLPVEMIAVDIYGKGNRKLALSNLKFSVVFINCRRHEKENVVCLGS